MWRTPHAVHSVDKCAIRKMLWIIQCAQVCRVLCINKLVIHTTQTPQCVLKPRMSLPYPYLHPIYSCAQHSKWDCWRIVLVCVPSYLQAVAQHDIEFNIEIIGFPVSIHNLSTRVRQSLQPFWLCYATVVLKLC